MPKIVAVPNVGNVEFPDSMSDDEVSAAIRKSVAGPQAEPLSNWQKIKNAAGDFAAGVGKEINPVTMAAGARDLAYNAVTHPINTVGNMLKAQSVPVAKAIDAAKAGDYIGAARHAAGAMIPLAGPAIDEMGDEAQNGQMAHALGRAAGFGAVSALPGSEAGNAISGAVGKLRVPVKLPAATNPVQAAAVDFGRANDIPVAAGARSGNKFVQGVQAIADHSPLGSIVAKNAKNAEDAAFRRTAGQLADQVHPTPIVPTQAGLAATDELKSGIQGFHQEANQHYNNIREIEADPANKETVIQGYKTEQVPGQEPRQVPITEDVALPADTQSAKDALKPLYQRMVRQMPVTQERASAGLKAMRNIMDGPRYVSASQLEEDLSTIKGIARGADLPELRNLSQSLAAKAVEAVDGAVRDALGRAKRSDANGAAAAAPAPAEPTPAVAQPTNGPYQAGTAETSIPVPGAEKRYPARYEVRELADVQPSHHGQTFEPNPKYTLKNERTYTDPVDREKVAANATPEAFDPARHLTDNTDAVNGPTIIDQQGNALGGNGRAMMLQRIYASREGSAAAKYRDMLMKKADQFGVDRGKIAQMKQPILTRVIGDDAFTAPGMSKADAIADFNKVPTASLKQSEQAIRDARGVSGSTLDFLSKGLDEAGEGATLAKVLDTHGEEVIQKLVSDGVISPQERSQYLAGGKINSTGREKISNLMLGRFFSDAGAMEGLAPAMRAKLERVAPHMGRVEGDAAWNLSPHIKQAVDLIEEGRAHGIKDLQQLRDQYTDLFGNNQKYSDEAGVLAKHLQDNNPTALTRAARDYVDHAKYAREYQGPGLSGEFPDPHTPTSGFNQAFGSQIERQAPEVAAPEAPRWNPRAADPADVGTSNAPPPPKPKPVIPSRPVGSEALASLEAGRRATAEKYGVSKVLDQLHKSGTEGRQVFDQATWKKDSGVEYLKQLAQKAPQSIPKLGRATLENLFEPATAEGGFDRAKTIWGRWQDIGPETKKILFKSENPQMVKDLDNFFQLAKMRGDHGPNPSGTATTIAGVVTPLGYAFNHPYTGVPLIIGMGALSKLMHSPAALDALTNGLRVGVSQSAAARTLAASRILKVVGSAAQPAAALPLAAAANPSPQTAEPTLTAAMQ